MTVDPGQRFKKNSPCPICSGYDGELRGRGVRCFGFVSADGSWAHCTREEHAGGLALNSGSNTYAHRLAGDCDCGSRHDPYPRSRKEEAKRSKTFVAAYDYRDEVGVLSYQVLRYRYDDNGEKSFLQRRPDGNGGWVYNLDGVTRFPYRLPELLVAPLDTPIYVPEGEDDVDRLVSLGLVATCNSGGAGKFPPEFAPWFEGRRVVLIQDNDKDGERHMAKTAPILLPLAEAVKVIDFPELDEHSDVSDWLDAGYGVEELTKRVEKAPLVTPESFRIPEPPMLGGSEETLEIVVIPSTEVPLPEEGESEGLLDPIVPGIPALVVISGETSAGKTVLARNIAFHIAEGTEMADLLPKRPLRVLYVDLESPESVHRSLVDTVGRSPNLAFVRDLPVTLNRPEGMAEFVRACRSHASEVVFLDPLSIVKGGVKVYQRGGAKVYQWARQHDWERCRGLLKLWPSLSPDPNSSCCYA